MCRAYGMESPKAGMTIVTAGEIGDFSVSQFEDFEVTDKGVELARTVVSIRHKTCDGCVKVARSWRFEGSKTCAYIEPRYEDEDLSIIEDFAESMLTIEWWG